MTFAQDPKPLADCTNIDPNAYARAPSGDRPIATGGLSKGNGIVADTWPCSASMTAIGFVLA